MRPRLQAAYARTSGRKECGERAPVRSVDLSFSPLSGMSVNLRHAVGERSGPVLRSRVPLAPPLGLGPAQYGSAATKANVHAGHEGTAGTGITVSKYGAGRICRLAYRRLSDPRSKIDPGTASCFKPPGVQSPRKIRIA